jgi:hypothetical protein
VVSEDTKAEIFWGWLKMSSGNVEKEVERAAVQLPQL